MSAELAVVLHTHMPYVEGYGTWPFGEEWLWEAVATSYLPLLDRVLARAPLTLSVTPVLADQLEAPGAMDRCLAFLRDVRPESHRRDLAGCSDPALRAVLEESAADYAWAAGRLEALGGDLLGALAPHVRWTSSATHAVLPLLATDAGIDLQLRSGIAAHRRRFGSWGGGFWLPECAHAPWLDGHLADAGVRAACVDWTDRFGPGAVEHLRPYAAPGGVALVPLDRVTIELAWSHGAYPAHADYRNHHGLTEHHHRAWSNAGAPYDRAAARARARTDAADFVARVRGRLAGAEAAGVADPLVVCALDTELLGHWWFEGVWWLEAVIGEAAAQGLPIAGLDDAVARREPAPLPGGPAPTTSWGSPRDLSTWDGPQVADLAWRAREAELRVLGGGAPSGPRSPRALRELLALQSSDWAFLVTRDTAGPYPRERADGHAAALDAALAAPNGTAHVRNLAPDLA